jgi:hypothetical protein
MKVASECPSGFNLGPMAAASGVFRRPFISSWDDIANWGYFWGYYNNQIDYL